MARVNYVVQFDGQLFFPVMRNWLMRCCDCGLVHDVSFGIFRMLPGSKTVQRVKDRRLVVGMVVFRDPRKTAASRRRK